MSKLRGHFSYEFLPCRVMKVWPNALQERMRKSTVSFSESFLMRGLEKANALVDYC